jgi:hypothetical protein
MLYGNKMYVLWNNFHTHTGCLVIGCIFEYIDLSDVINVTFHPGW